MSNLLNNSFYGGTDRILFTTRVGEIAIKEVVSIRENATIQEAAQAMAKSRISSIIVMDEANQPAGIVTDRDLREKVIACGRDVRGLAATIMSPALIRADADEYCFDAVLKMIKHDAHQILIIKDGKFQGLLTTEDLMGLQGDSPFSFAREIEPQQTIEGIVRLSARLGSIVRFLIREGARAVVITRIMSELKDRLISKVLTMAEKHFGVLPASYCWITYGSEGRREQVLGMNFDSGLIYADPASPEQGEPVRKYFVGFAAFVDDVLKRCGFVSGIQGNPLCRPEWCQPLSAWKQYFSDWILSPTTESVLKSLKFLDFRAVAGDETLTESLRGHIMMLVKRQDEFLSRMATLIARNRQPSGILRVLRLPGHLSLEKTVDISASGLEPLTDAARLLALALAVPESTTKDRIVAVSKKDPGVSRQCDEMSEALELLLQLQIRHQVELFGKGEVPHNVIEYGRLSSSERHHLREAFQAIHRIVDNIADHYRLRLIGV